jgi:hypothetical protein
MNRRHFLRATAAAVGALTLDPERLLWVPGQRTYFDIVRPFSDVLTFRGMEVFYDEDCDGCYVYNPKFLKMVYLNGHEWSGPASHAIGRFLREAGAKGLTVSVSHTHV